MYSYFKVQNENYIWVFQMYIYQFQLKMKNDHIVFLKEIATFLPVS